MKLITKEIERRLPKLYSQENVSDPVVHVKFFLGGWTWYITEGDLDEGRLFGYVVGMEAEFGYVSLHELQTVRGQFGLGVERDLYFQPGPLSEVLAREGHESHL